MATRKTKSNIEKINSIFSDIDNSTIKSTAKSSSNLVDEEISKIIKENNFSSMEQVIQYMNDNYQNLVKPSEPEEKITDEHHRTSPGKLTIDSPYKCIKINEYINNVSKHPYTLTEVMIIYVKDFDDERDYTDTVIFTCASMDDLYRYWNSFVEQHNLYNDCICSVSVNITEADRRYVKSVDNAIMKLIPSLIQWDNNDIDKAISKQQNTGIVKIVLDTLFSNAGVRIVYPHVSSEYNKETGLYDCSVKRYWGE